MRAETEPDFEVPPELDDAADVAEFRAAKAKAKDDGLRVSLAELQAEL